MSCRDPRAPPSGSGGPPHPPVRALLRTTDTAVGVCVTGFVKVGPAESSWRSPGQRVTRILTVMLRSIDRSQLIVTDQDVALDLDVDTLDVIAADVDDAVFSARKFPSLDIADDPSPRPYGIDVGIHDPLNNAFRLGQLFDPTGA